MTGTAEPGNCLTKRRGEGRRSPGATDRKVEDHSLHQPVREEVACWVATARCGWPVPLKGAPATSWLAAALGVAVTQETVASWGGSGAAPSGALKSRRLDVC
jgi:hypothetical protein